ncbi:hypothetical protein TWF506_009113 [Arthrobotrys conoides]|uniref:Uncharacterized protein n=1 Tax=Arthrobotrys conoides TaxID=74498 RepID=A0AAN8RTD6_9PEZI
MTSRSTESIVGPEVARYFEKLGLFEPIKGNKRKVSPSTISQGRLSPTSSHQASHHFAPANLLDGPALFSSASIHEMQAFIEIPVFLRSQETLEIIGFNPEKAQSIWNSWEGIPETEKSPDLFLEFVLEFISDPRGSQQAINGDDDWNAYMDNIGISSWLKSAILLPEYEIIRYTASCQFWLLDSVKWTYRALESLPERFEVAAEYFRSGHSRIKCQDSDPDTNKADIKNPATYNISSSDPPAGQFRATGEESGTFIPDGTGRKLYKATTIERAKAFYSEQTGLVREGRFGSFPGDLSGQSLLTYWTPQRELADIHAGYLKHRVPISEIIITEVDVSGELIVSLKPVYLWGRKDMGINPHFQEFTWSCRNGYQKNEMPSYLRYLAKGQLIIAHILDHKTVDYKKRDSWKDVEISNLLHLNIDGAESLGVQWVFRSTDAKGAFNKHCQGRVIQYNLNMLTIAD